MKIHYGLRNHYTPTVATGKSKRQRIPSMQTPTKCSTPDETVYGVFEAYGRGDPINQIIERFQITKGCLDNWIKGVNRQHVLRAYEAKYGPLEIRSTGRPKRKNHG